MIIQAELKCKQTGCEADPCAVDKVIELPSQRFQQFSHALLADYPIGAAKSLWSWWPEVVTFPYPFSCRAWQARVAASLSSPPAAS